MWIDFVWHNILFSSSDFEIVDGVLILDVKSESSMVNLGGTSGGAISYKVRIEQTPGARRFCLRHGFCLRDVCSFGWTFTCSCPSHAEPPGICKHIGACLIVHFYAPPDEDSEDEDSKHYDEDYEEDYDEDYERDYDGDFWVPL